VLAAVVLFSEVILGWRLRIRTDSVEGPDSGGFGRIPSSPAGGLFGPFCILYGHFHHREQDSGF